MRERERERERESFEGSLKKRLQRGKLLTYFS